jgi:hypothetical protein
MNQPGNSRTYRIVNDALDGDQYSQAGHVDVVLFVSTWGQSQWEMVGTQDRAKVGIASGPVRS